MYEETKLEKFMDWSADHPLTTIFMTLIIICLIGFSFLCVHLSTGEKQYTGYIYSAEDSIAKTVGHIRFSENAGMDEQPAFCVDKRDGQQIKDLAGSGKKVRVTIPSGFAFSFPWTCPIPASVEIME